jgi:hypothetical protein
MGTRVACLLIEYRMDSDPGLLNRILDAPTLPCGQLPVFPPRPQSVDSDVVARSIPSSAYDYILSKAR